MDEQKIVNGVYMFILIAASAWVVVTMCAVIAVWGLFLFDQLSTLLEVTR